MGELNSETRANLPGSFIELSKGWVHYELAGTGEKVVLVHGFSGPQEIWNPTFPALVKAGFSVLRYDLYGRGTSDRPREKYNPELFDGQLFELLTAMKWDGPIHLIGLSMGGAVATFFTDRHPEKVKKLILIDPAGFQKMPILSKLVCLPGLGELMIRWTRPFLYRATRRVFQTEENFGKFFPAVEAQMKFKGFSQALLSTLRYMPLGAMEKVYQEVGKLQKPTLLIWGKEDKILPYSLHKKIISAIPHLEFYPVEGVGHCPQYEKPDEINPRLVRFLRD